MEFKSRMIHVNECHALLASISPLGRLENVLLNDSLGRVLAQDIMADTDQPPFDKSAMDGYACYLADLPGPLSIAGSIAAGEAIEKKLETGSCYRIFTGAPVPPGTDCVIMQEHTEKDSNGNILFTQKETKNNICYQGEDMKAGEVAIKVGAMIQPQHLAVMASFGVTQLLVANKPKVAIVCSGSELVEPSVEPGKATIRNSNAYQLIGQVSALGAKAYYLGIVADYKESITKSIADAIGKYDVIIVTGGASVGDYDFMPDVLNELGAITHFSALNIQPGKPVLFATLGKTNILGLSGNPVSSYLQFLLVAKPLLLRLAGCTMPSIKIARIPLAEPVKRKKSNRQLYVPIVILPSGFVKPVPFNGSAHIAALTGIDGFAILDIDVNEITENKLVDVLLI